MSALDRFSAWCLIPSIMDNRTLLIYEFAYFEWEVMIGWHKIVRSEARAKLFLFAVDPKASSPADPDRIKNQFYQLINFYKIAYEASTQFCARNCSGHSRQLTRLVISCCCLSCWERKSCKWNNQVSVPRYLRYQFGETEV